MDAELRRGSRPEQAPLSAQSVHHVHSLTRRLLNQAVRWGWISRNPAQKCQPAEGGAVRGVLPTPAEVSRILAAAGEKDPDLGCFLRLPALTGARRGEVCAIRWNDMNGNVLRISHAIVGTSKTGLIEKDTKTHANRQVVLDKATVAMLSDHHERCSSRAAECGVPLSDTTFVFSDDPAGTTPWRPNRVTIAFVRLCREFGIHGVRLHDLRHFAATQLLGKGVPVKSVSGRLGHANASTTLNGYAHLPSEVDEVAADVLAGVIDDQKKSTRPSR